MNASLLNAASIATIVVTATAGDVLIAAAMRSFGDLDILRHTRGLLRTIVAVATSPLLLMGIVCMALSFFALLFALNHGSLSLIAPASASLTFVTNSIAAKVFLKENVDHRRWTAAILVCIGVALMAN